MNKLYVLTLCLGMLIGIGGLALLQNFKKDIFLNPLGNNPQILAVRVPSNKPIIGFLPYWNINSVQIPYHLLDYICYFSINLNADGSIKKVDEGNTDIGWLKLKSDEIENVFILADKQEVGRMVSFTAFNNDLIDTLIGLPTARKKAISSIISIVKEYELDGVNIDFEYHTGYPIGRSPSDMVTFIKQLKEELSNQQLENVVVSIDLYANAFITKNLYDSVALSQTADWLVLMGYDFHQTGSNYAGPVAPLKSTTGKSITQALDSALKNGIETNKIILAMPFYGYEWQTVDDTHKSATYPDSGAMASYRRVYALIEEKDIQPQWDNQAMSPWLAYKENGITKQIYYENDQSIGYKLQMISQLQIQGAAIWALGYEGKDASIWNVIEEWRKNQN